MSVKAPACPSPVLAAALDSYQFSILTLIQSKIGFCLANTIIPLDLFGAGSWEVTFVLVFFLIYVLAVIEPWRGFMVVRG